LSGMQARGPDARLELERRLDQHGPTWMAHGQTSMAKDTAGPPRCVSLSSRRQHLSSPRYWATTTWVATEAGTSWSRYASGDHNRWSPT
jgi:hypothetical protein